MRYQDLIYIQNQNSVVRNKIESAVNTSSDMYIFEAPKYTMSGVSKFDCSCGCPTGFTLLKNGDCQYVNSISATSYGTIYTAYTGSVNSNYNSSGAKFYHNNLTGNLPYSLDTLNVVKDSSGTTITEDYAITTGLLWASNFSTSYGRLNLSGVWTTYGAPASNPPFNQWIGFSKCINIPTSGTYTIGIAGDNRVKFSLNGDLFYEANISSTYTFTSWRVFEVTLSAGTNIIELQGYNDSLAASFGAEIYNASVVDLQKINTVSELEKLIVFSTKNYRYDVVSATTAPTLFNLGESSGFSCPAGYFLNTCVTPFSCSTLVTTACTVSTGEYYIIDSATTIPVTFSFTGDLSSFTATNATFNFEVYKYNNFNSGFTLPSLYVSSGITYSAISGTSSYTENVPVSKLKLDGQYLIKGYYQYNPLTDYASRLNKTITTSTFLNQANLYDKNLDYSFTAFESAKSPTFLINASQNLPSNKLFQQVILPKSGENVITITQQYSGFFVLTLNGLVLAPNYDYTYTGNVITLSSSTVDGDIITVSYTTQGLSTLAGDNLYINTSIVSGATNNEGANLVYFNTSTNKYEIYTSVAPTQGSSIIVMLNGATLANNIDYYQSTTKPRRIILEGNLMVGDMLTIVYFPSTNVSNGIITNNPNISWSIPTAPQLNNGYFSLQVSTASTFNTFYYSGLTNYVVGSSIYNDSFIASGTVGTKLYYRVKNVKNFVTTCNKTITSEAYSDTITVTIQSNAINSY